MSIKSDSIKSEMMLLILWGSGWKREILFIDTLLLLSFFEGCWLLGHWIKTGKTPFILSVSYMYSGQSISETNNEYYKLTGKQADETGL